MCMCTSAYLEKNAKYIGSSEPSIIRLMLFLYVCARYMLYSIRIATKGLYFPP